MKVKYTTFADRKEIEVSSLSLPAAFVVLQEVKMRFRNTGNGFEKFSVHCDHDESKPAWEKAVVRAVIPKSDIISAETEKNEKLITEQYVRGYFAGLQDLLECREDGDLLDMLKERWKNS